MSVFVAKKAKRTRRPLKVSAEGVSGGGKTFTLIRLAYDMKRNGIGKNIVVFDTENESAALYAGQLVDGERWDFMHVDMPHEKRNPAGFAEAYEWAVSQGYDIIIFDSLSHAWHGALELVDQMSRGGDKMRAWANMSPQQRQMIQTLTDPRAHCLVSMRVKTDFQESEGPGGKKRMQKVGLKADQRDNTEYEFDLVLRFEAGNECHVEKVRGCSEMNGRSVNKPGPAFWKPLLDWWKAGDDVTPAAQPAVAPVQQQQPAGDRQLYESLLVAVKDAESVEEARTAAAAAEAQFKAGTVSEPDITKIRCAYFFTRVRFATNPEEMAAVTTALEAAFAAGKVSETQAAAVRKKVDERAGQFAAA